MSHNLDRLEKIRAISIFAGCTNKELEEIDRLADEVEIEAGRTIIRQGELGQEFAMVVSGEADVVKNGKTIATVGPGGYFGEVALLDAVARSASVVAKTDMELQVIGRVGFNTLLDDLPQLSRSLLRGLARRITELNEAMEELRLQTSSDD